MQKQILLSIIVPVYNVEPFLRKCVESIENQDLAHNLYEVILVNDGSTDRCGEICRGLAEQYANILLINQKNQGLSMARNAGMDIAQGKYWMFVDSDDYIESNAIGRVLDIAEQNKTDLCFFSSMSFNEHGAWDNGYQPFEHNKIYTGEYVILNGMNISSVWKNIYLADFIKRTGLRFRKGLINEDIDFNYKLYPLAHRIMFTDILVYHYNCSFAHASLTRNKDAKQHQRALLCSLEIVKEILHYCDTVLISKAVKRLYRRRMRSLLVSSILSAYTNHQYYNGAFLHQLLDKAHAYHLYPIWGRIESWKTTIIMPLINLLWLKLFLSHSCMGNNSDLC